MFEVGAYMNGHVLDLVSDVGPCCLRVYLGDADLREEDGALPSPFPALSCVLCVLARRCNLRGPVFTPAPSHFGIKL